MKIALPTNDGASVSPHFGRSAGFLVFEVADGKIKSRQFVRNTGCHSHDHHEAPGATAVQTHSGIVSALEGCSVVICAGIGGGAVQALKSVGVSEVLVTVPGDAEQTVNAFLAGSLPVAGQGFCRCSH